MHSLLSAGVPQSPVTPVTRNGLWHVVTGVLWAGFTTGKFPSGTKRDPQYLSNPFGGMQASVPSAFEVTSDWAPGKITKFLWQAMAPIQLSPASVSSFVQVVVAPVSVFHD